MLMQGLVITVLLVANALFVAAEFSAVAAERSRLSKLAHDGSGRARRLMAMLEDGAQLDRYIAACQIGITLSSLIAGAYAQATIALDLATMLERLLDVTTASAHSTAAIVVLVGLTALQVVLGELVPKSLALQFPEQTVLATFVPMRWFASVSRGFVWALNGSGFLLLRPFGIKPVGHQHVHSPDEIRILITESQRGGALTPEISKRLQRGLRLSARTVGSLMIPREDIYGVDASSSPDELLRRIIESPYSRLPVYEGSLDTILGAVSTKDVVGIYAERGSLPPVAEIVRPIPFVRENLRADRFVRFLERHRSSKAVVVDASSTVLGFVSIADVLGELFGEIGDELKSAELESVTPVPVNPDAAEEPR